MKKFFNILGYFLHQEIQLKLLYVSTLRSKTHWGTIWSDGKSKSLWARTPGNRWVRHHRTMVRVLPFTTDEGPGRAAPVFPPRRRSLICPRKAGLPIIWLSRMTCCNLKYMKAHLRNGDCYQSLISLIYPISASTYKKWVKRTWPN